MSLNQVQTEGKQRLEKALAHLQDMLRGIRTGRASAALVENVRVDYYGTATPLSQMAQISVPEPRQIMIKPFDAGVIKEIAKALMKSELGNPQEDGKVLRLTLPPLSGEQRTKYAGKVKEICEEARISMRNARRDLNKHAETMLKDSKLTEDEHRKLQQQIQDLLKEYEGKVDEQQRRKTQEILEV